MEATETVPPCGPGVNAGLTVGDGLFYSVLAVLAFLALGAWLRSMSRMW